MSDNKSEFSRRKFLTTSLYASLAAGFASAIPGSARADTSESSEKKADGKPITRMLGRTGIEVPIVGMGVGAATHPNIIQAAYEKGVRYFDTAANYQYGRNEQMVGQVFDKMKVRDQVVITTKIMIPQQRAGLKGKQYITKVNQLLEGSLRRLKTDYIDVLMVHSVETADDFSDPGLIEAMKLVKQQKKARAIGLSSHTGMADVIEGACKTEDWDVILTSYNLAQADDERLQNAVETAGKKGIGLVAMKTMAGGASWPNPETREGYTNQEIVITALKWVLNNKNISVSIPGYASHDHLDLDFKLAYDLNFTKKEKKLLNDNKIILGMGFCRQCKTCLASCPENVEIPTLMRTHMYAKQYADFYLARQTMSEIPLSKNLSKCSSCRECVAKCAQSVDIPSRINELKMIYS